MALGVAPNAQFDAIEHRIREMQGLVQRDGMDAQELGEREEAAQAYTREDEMHFVEYLEACVRTSRNSTVRLRQLQQECWALYQEDEPPNYRNKEEWQSRVVIPKPFAAVQVAKNMVRKAFTPEFLAIDNEPQPEAGEFWQTLMLRMLDHDHANFRIRFPDATEMGLAVGTSMELIPYWDARRGLQYALVEPWKIHRDPDASSRDPQSGLYWIHEEFQDLWVLEEAERTRQYQGVTAVREQLKQAHNPENPEMDPESQAELRKMFWVRNSYRDMALVREFYGTVLDKQGHLLLPNATYTVAGRHVIGLPKVTPFPTLRWPGISFSPLPHLLRYDGRGILQGVRTLWYWMCSLLALHSDNLNWVVNPMTEINQQALVDQSDIDSFPGRTWLVRATISGQQAIRTIARRCTTNEGLANLQQGARYFQEGTFVTSTAQGLPGYRSEITFREVAMMMDQSRDLFSSLGVNIEDGALWAIKAGMETVQLNITRQDLLRLFRPEELQRLLAVADQGGMPSPIDEGLVLPGLQGTFSVSGLTAVLKDLDVVKSISELLLPLSKDPFYAPYLKPFRILKSIETRLNLQDEGIIATADEAKQIAQGQAAQASKLQEQQEGLIALQVETEQQRLALEREKQALEAQKLALEARQMELEAQQAEAEAALTQEELVGQAAQVAQEVRRTDAEIQQIMAEIGRTVLQSQAIAEQLRLDEARVGLQARQVEGQLQIQRLQAEAAIKASQQRRREGARNGPAVRR